MAASAAGRDYFQRGFDPSPLRFPVLLKPARGGYGRGIRRFDTPAELRAFFVTTPPAEPCVLQEWIDGDDVDCSVLCEDGLVLASTVQRALQPGYRPYASPSAVEICEDPEAIGLTASLMDALGFSGVAHVDLRLDRRDGRLKVIEINPRFWGSLGASFAAGVNFPWLACLAALGEPVPHVRPDPVRYHGGRAAAMQWLSLRPLRRAGRWDASGLGLLLRDPLPALSHAVGRALRRTRPAPAPV